MVFRVVEWFKEGDALDVIPVKVGKENTSFQALVPELRQKLLAEQAQSAPTVENQNVPLRSPNLQARGIAAVAKIIRRWRGSGTSHPPKAYLHGCLLYH